MDAFSLFASLSLDTSGYEEGLSGAKNTAESFGDKLKNGLATAAKIGAEAIAAATAAAAGFAAASVKVGAEFDSSMSQVAATMGTTVDSIQNLREFALEMGSSTSFSASQAADALNYMALAGYDAETAMSMLPNVLNLAAAGGMELAAASDMVTDAASALGLSIEETADMVDMMAVASSKTNTSVAQLGEAILTVGGTAKNLAGGTNELATSLGLLADNGIKGAEGGTALRNIILSLSAPTNTAAKAMAQLGINAFDADGNMRPLNETFADLGAALSSLTQGEQTQVLNEIFNKTDLGAVNALLSTSAERWDEVSDAIGNAAGAAQQMAETQLDNLSGDIVKLQSALEGAQIAVADRLMPSMREFVQFGTSGISELSAAFQSGGFAGAMEALGGILSEGLGMVTAYIPQMVQAGTGLLMALIQGMASNLPALAASAIEVVSTLAGSISESLPELIPVGIEAILQIVETLIDNVDVLVDAAIEIVVALSEGIIANLPTLIEKGPEIVQKLVSAIIDNAPRLLEAAAEVILSLVSGIGENLPDIVLAGGEIITSFITGIGELISSLLGKGAEIVETVKSGITNKAAEAKQWGKDLINNFVNGIRSGISAVKNAVSNVASTVKNFIGFSEPEEGPLSNFHTYAPDMMKLFADGIRDNAYLVQSQLDKSLDFDFGTANVDFASLGFSKASNVTGGISSSAVQPITLIVQSVLDGKVIGETSYNYIRNREKTYGVT